MEVFSFFFFFVGGVIRQSHGAIYHNNESGDDDDDDDGNNISSELLLKTCNMPNVIKYNLECFYPHLIHKKHVWSRSFAQSYRRKYLLGM